MKGLLILAVSLLTVGCSGLGLAPATNLDTRLANAYGVYTSVNQATTAALQSGTLSADNALAVQGMQKNARALLDTARSLEQSNPSGAQSNLTLALSALTAIQSYLNNHGGGKDGRQSSSESGGGPFGRVASKRYAGLAINTGCQSQRLGYAGC